MYVNNLISEFDIPVMEDSSSLLKHSVTALTMKTGVYIYINVNISQITNNGIMSVSDTISIEHRKLDNESSVIVTRIYSGLPSLNGNMTDSKYTFIKKLLTDKQISYVHNNCSTFITITEKEEVL